MRPRRKRLVQASKITDWLRDSPSQSNAPAAPEPPSQSPTVCVPADPKPQVEEKKKTRRRRRKAKKTMEEEEVPSVPRAMVSTSAVGETSNGRLLKMTGLPNTILPLELRAPLLLISVGWELPLCLALGRRKCCQSKDVLTSSNWIGSTFTLNTRG